MRFAECFLDGVQALGRAEGFDRHQLVTMCLHCEHQTRANRFAVKEDGARAAHSMLTADVGSGQSKLVPQKVAQQQPRLNTPQVRGPIDRKGNLVILTHSGLLAKTKSVTK
jgi:hypothetical protein